MAIFVVIGVLIGLLAIVTLAVSPAARANQITNNGRPAVQRGFLQWSDSSIVRLVQLIWRLFVGFFDRIQVALFTFSSEAGCTKSIDFSMGHGARG